MNHLQSRAVNSEYTRRRAVGACACACARCRCRRSAPSAPPRRPAPRPRTTSWRRTPAWWRGSSGAGRRSQGSCSPLRSATGATRATEWAAVLRNSRPGADPGLVLLREPPDLELRLRHPDQRRGGHDNRHLVFQCPFPTPVPHSLLRHLFIGVAASAESSNARAYISVARVAD